MNKTVDVIIPVCYPDEKLQKILDRLKLQTYPVERIIIINTEEDGFPKNLNMPDNMEVHHITKAEFDHGTTRAMAAAMSSADLMLFMTQDALPADRRLVEHLAAAFNDERVAAAYARQLARKSDSPIEKFTRNFNYPPESSVKSLDNFRRNGIKTFFCSNSCAMYRKDIYERLDGFLPRSIFNEDMIYASTAVRAGYSIAYVAEARVIHSHNYTAMQQFRRNFDNGVSHVDSAYAFEGVTSLGEGKRLVFETAGYLIRHKHYADIIKLFYISAFKAAGFVLGKKYYKLPHWLVKFCSMNKNYWDYDNEKEQEEQNS